MVKYAATLALLSVAVMCGTLSYSIVTVNKHLSATLMKLDDSLDKLNGKNGLIQEMGKTVVDTKKLIALANVAENNEISSIAGWNGQISQTLTDLHDVMGQTQMTVAAIRPVAEATDTTIRALQAPIGQLNTDLAALQPVIAHTDALVSNPALTATISNVESTTSHLDATAADVQQEVHSITHPTWAHKVWSWSLALVHALNPL